MRIQETFYLASLCLLAGCENRESTPGGGTSPTAVQATTSVPAISAVSSRPTSTSPERVGVGQPMTVSHIRVTVKQVTIGRVPLKAVDGSIEYAEPPRLMVALRIHNISDKRQSPYNTWVPDLDAAKTVAVLKDDRGVECKRITFGFGNNVKDRTVLDTLSPGKAITDLLVFEVPGPTAKYVDLELPGANCGVKGSFQFRIELKAITGWK